MAASIATPGGSARSSGYWIWKAANVQLLIEQHQHHPRTTGCCVLVDVSLLLIAEPEDEAALAAREDVELAAALEESARLEVGATRAAGDQARVAEGASSPAAEAPLEGEEEPPDDFICPITTEVMSDPVMAADGHAYERSAIERWLATKSTSPLTGGALEHSILVPNHMLRRQIRDWEGARKAV
ncbi:hypothetical protein EMIHUDRAFT_212771 [Emiliania huxleyi CCMP1516]|uniref:U-box domain-containing protein n=2 Tax=Emiliania huxleyi TaxID=2903 RepID=A0A0D3IP88_EMIH1|nr:hypothetical protein EMIHUDRAFT_212771 [Emiliania huxleyi CCMP1516]EOD13073.1 hypothetical protein EMIHUDRAFT_212771 [Emiliania huxleyi CCMP1516]|eukprot:XP_005765502.1 hypothetical protein EMIHUDRAFT_212771 [Emiliania huxleyi CCMP1516]